MILCPAPTFSITWIMVDVLHTPPSPNPSHFHSSLTGTVTTPSSCFHNWEKNNQKRRIYPRATWTYPSITTFVSLPYTSVLWRFWRISFYSPPLSHTAALAEPILCRQGAPRGCCRRFIHTESTPSEQNQLMKISGWREIDCFPCVSPEAVS